MKITKPLFTFDLITLMPEMFKALTSFGVTGRAFNSGLVELNLCNPRNFTKDIHKTVDDKSYGGGPGMLMMVEPLVEAIHSIKDLQSKKELNSQINLEIGYQIFPSKKTDIVLNLQHICNFLGVFDGQIKGTHWYSIGK